MPSPELTAALRDRDSFALLRAELEDETVAAYADGVPRIRDPKLRQPLGSIMACGAAHVVALKDSLGRSSWTNLRGAWASSRHPARSSSW